MARFKPGDRVWGTKFFFHGEVRANFTYPGKEDVTYCVVVTQHGNMYCPPEDYLELAKPLVLLVSSGA